LLVTLKTGKTDIKLFVQNKLAKRVSVKNKLKKNDVSFFFQIVKKNSRCNTSWVYFYVLYISAFFNKFYNYSFVFNIPALMLSLSVSWFWYKIEKKKRKKNYVTH